MGGESPISFLSIDAYGRRYVDDEDFDRFFVLVGAMDDEYLQHVDRVRKAEKEAEENRKRFAEGG